jgi:hypothetical protein
MTASLTTPVKIEIVATVSGHPSRTIGEFTVDAEACFGPDDATGDVTATLDMDAFSATLADGLVSAAGGIRNGALKGDGS